MALRCMNPQVIVCDELGTPGDAEAVAQGVASGVVFFATVHCDDPAGLRKKPALAALLDTGAFAKAAFLSGAPSRCGGAVGDAVTLLLRLLGTLLLLLAGMAAALPPLPAPRTAAASCTALPACLHTWPSCWTHRRSPDRSYYAAQRRTRRLPFFVPHRGEPVRADTSCLYAGRTAAGGAVEPFRRRGGPAPDWPVPHCTAWLRAVRRSLRSLRRAPHGPAAMAAAGGRRRNGRHFAVVRSGPYGHRPCF